MALVAGSTVRHRIKRGEIHRYRAAVPAHTFVSLEVDQQEIDLVVSAQLTGGPVRAEVDFGPFGREVLSLIALQPGTYDFSVDAKTDSTAKGSYALRLYYRGVQPTDSQRVQAQEMFDAAKHTDTNTREGFSAAINLYSAAAKLWRGAEDTSGEAAALFNLGATYDRAGQREDAYTCYSAALHLFEGLHDPFGRLESLRQIGRLQGHLGQKFEFVPSDAEFVQMWRKLGDRRGVAEALAGVSGGLLKNAYDTSAFEQVLDYANRAADLYLSLGDRNGQRRVLEDAVLAYQQLNRYDRALPLADQLLQIARASHDARGEAACLDTLGRLLINLGHYREGIRQLDESLVLRHAQGDRTAEIAVHIAIANTYNSLDEPQSALPHVRAAQALERSLRREMKTAIWREGFSGGYLIMPSYQWTLLSLDRQFPGRGYKEQAFLATDQGHGRMVWQDASAPNQVTVAQLQRELLDKDTVLLEYSIAGYIPRSPRDSQERWSPENLVWVLTPTSLAVYPLPFRSDIEDLVHKLYLTISQPDALKAPSESQQRAMRELSHVLLGPAVTQLGAKKMLIVCDDVMEYVPFAALPDPARADQAPLIANHEIRYLPSASTTVLFRRSAPGTRKPGRFLAVVADPVFGPDDPRVKGGVPTPGPPAMDRGLVRAVRAFGYDSGTVPRLPYSRREAANVLRWAPRHDSLALLDFSATRQALLNGRLSDYSIIHIATHGLVNDDDPDLSGLLFSLVDRNGRPRDGFLRTKDIYSLRLSSDLVVLSACESALGKAILGEGMLSITSGFLYAGAAAVLATAWKVNDEATAAFMNAFYAELLGAHHRTPAAALRAAQISFINSPRWHAPYYWAGFTLHDQAR